MKPTDALHSNFISITTLHISGNISAHRQEVWAVRRLWYISYNIPKPTYSSELLMMGRKAARNM